MDLGMALTGRKDSWTTSGAPSPSGLLFPVGSLDSTTWSRCSALVPAGWVR